MFDHKKYILLVCVWRREVYYSQYILKELCRFINKTIKQHIHNKSSTAIAIRCLNNKYNITQHTTCAALSLQSEQWWTNAVNAHVTITQQKITHIHTRKHSAKHTLICSDERLHNIKIRLITKALIMLQIRSEWQQLCTVVWLLKTGKS